MMGPTITDGNPNLSTTRQSMTATHNPDPRESTRFLILRHGETAAPDLFHGSESDIGLGPNGQEQAQAAAKLLARRKPHAIYCSGMRRSVETARPIAEICGLPLQIEPDLRERRMGPLSGFSRTEGWPIYEEAKGKWMSGDLHFTHEGGESFEEIRDRIVPVLQKLSQKHRGETVVLVGHGVANRVLISSLADGFSAADFDSITIEFVKISELTWDGAVWSLARTDGE